MNLNEKTLKTSIAILIVEILKVLAQNLAYLLNSLITGRLNKALDI